MSRPLLLASASPRRRELLQQLGLRFTLAPAAIDEAPLPGEDPAALVSRLAQAKAQAGLALAEPAQWVLGADTVVVLDREILGKPADDAAAAAMLRRLSGRAHTVFSGVFLACSGVPGRGRVVRTRVWMRGISEPEIVAYVASGEPLGKAGAYAIQGRGAAFVRCLAGSYSNVVGLPLYELDALLRELPEPPERV